MGRDGPYTYHTQPYNALLESAGLIRLRECEVREGERARDDVLGCEVELEILRARGTEGDAEGVGRSVVIRDAVVGGV